MYMYMLSNAYLIHISLYPQYRHLYIYIYIYRYIIYIYIYVKNCKDVNVVNVYTVCYVFKICLLIISNHHIEGS